MNRKFLLKLVFSALLIMGLAVVLTWLLEFRYYMGDAGAATNFALERPKVFLFNAWLMALILLLCSSLSGSIFRGGALVAAGVLIIGYIHINKFASRGTPLLPEDFQLASQAAALSKFVSVDSIIALVVSVLAVLVAGEVLERWVGQVFVSAHWQAKEHEPELEEARPVREFCRRHLVGQRAAVSVMAVLLFVSASAFVIQHGSGREQKIDFLDTTFVAWNQTFNYNDNGFLLGFLYNWSKFELTEPEDYSAERMAEIKTKYAAVAESGNATRQDLAEVDYDIVIVLDETFMDVASVEQYYPHSGGDVTPNLHALMEKYPSGKMFSPDYGGGTANIEFEVVTGLTNYWVNTVPYTSLLPRLTALPSVATLAKDSGYETVAVHPYAGGMYKRNITLGVEGFDEFITVSEFRHTEHEGSSEYINDKSAFREVLDVLEREGGKKLALTITMQNHTPYLSETYDKYDFLLETAPSGDAGRKAQIETYFQTLHNADAYLGEFIAELDKSERKTVVLFFGDHAPGIFNELNHPEDAEKFAVSRQTPYFIYANFELAEAEGLARELPTTTPNCLTNTMLNLLNAKKSGLGYLLDEVCAEQPILTPLYFGGEEPEWGEALNNYRLVTYDLLGGEQWWMNNSN